jgi:hypothetical protein
MLRRCKSFICERANILGPPSAQYSRGRSFDEKWEQTGVFARDRGRPLRIFRDVEDAIIEKTREDRRSSVQEVAHEMELSHESVRAIRPETGFKTTILFLFSPFNLMARN